MIRKVIREIGQAFQEGLQNAYQFSKGIGGELAQAMDTLATKSLTMKNQLGAAFGALLTNLMPIILKIIEIVTRAANAITQLFAVLGGKSGYNKAVDASQEWAKNTAAGAKSAKEMRNQLMGFDEINRLDAPSEPSGGGGGANATDYGSMFEWSEFDSWTDKLEPLKQALDGLWESIKTGASDAWAHITETIDFNQLLLDVIGTVQGVVEFVSGILSGDWDKAFAGAALAVESFGGIVNQAITFVAGIVDSLLGWLSNLVSSFFDWIYNSTGIRLFGLKNLIVGIIDTIRLWFGDIVGDLKTVLNGIIDFIAGVFTGDWERVWDGIKQIFAGIVQAVVDTFYGALNFVISALNGLAGFIGDVISWFGGSSNIGTIPLLQSPQVFATGGFPEDGLFFANHEELVGQFSNGNTAVANNEQIVEGIRRGVYDAMSSVMSNNSSNGVTKVYLDGKEIATAVTKQQKSLERSTGVSFA